MGGQNTQRAGQVTKRRRGTLATQYSERIECGTPATQYMIASGSNVAHHSATQYMIASGSNVAHHSATQYMIASGSNVAHHSATQYSERIECGTPLSDSVWRADRMWHTTQRLSMASGSNVTHHSATQYGERIECSAPAVT